MKSLEMKIEPVAGGVNVSTGGEPRFIEVPERSSPRHAAWLIYIGAYSPIEKRLQEILKGDAAVPAATLPIAVSQQVAKSKSKLDIAKLKAVVRLTEESK